MEKIAKKERDLSKVIRFGQMILDQELFMCDDEEEACRMATLYLCCMLEDPAEIDEFGSKQCKKRIKPPNHTVKH